MDYTKEQKVLVINWYNGINGTRYWSNVQANLDAAEEMLKAAEGDTKKIRDFIKANKGKLSGIVDCAEVFCNKVAQEKKEAEAKAKAEAEAKAAEAAKVAPAPTVDAGIDLIGKVVVELLAKTKADEIQTVVVDKAMEAVKEFIAKEYGSIERKVDLVIDGTKVPMEGVVHEKFDTILKFVKANEPVFLTGAAGTGKNYLCQQVAKALGLDFYFSNAVTQEYKITGFTDAMGTFHESQFFKAFKYGGLFMLDEMDASIPEVLIILNAAIANRYFDFPAPIGYVAAHPDFRVIAAGNTFGNGADYDYVGRNQLDAASLDRFAMVRIDYDKHIEESMACGNTELLGFCRAFRKAVNAAGIRTVVSYRAISRMAKLDASMKPDELIDTCLVKSLEVDDLNSIKDQLEGFGKYSDGFKKVLANRKKGVC